MTDRAGRVCFPAKGGLYTTVNVTDQTPPR
jgi:hypothetical protein